jgi:hypothetical protein
MSNFFIIAIMGLFAFGVAIWADKNSSREFGDFDVKK